MQSPLYSRTIWSCVGGLYPRNDAQKLAFSKDATVLGTRKLQLVEWGYHLWEALSIGIRSLMMLPCTLVSIPWNRSLMSFSVSKNSYSFLKTSSIINSGCPNFLCNTRVVYHIQFCIWVSLCSHGTQHWQETKWVFCYLEGTVDFSLFYGKGNSYTPNRLYF